MKLYAHPFSSDCQKVQVAFCEDDIAFDYRQVDGPDGPVTAELAAPFLPYADWTVPIDGRYATENSFRRFVAGQRVLVANVA